MNLTFNQGIRHYAQWVDRNNQEYSVQQFMDWFYLGIPLRLEPVETYADSNPTQDLLIGLAALALTITVITGIIALIWILAK